MEEKLLVTSRELIMVALICTAALSGVSGLVKKVSNPHIFKYLYKFIFFIQEDIESSLSIIHEVSSQSLGSLCVTEQFRSLTVPIDTLRFESARQKADLAATLLQDLGVAHHNGKKVVRLKLFIISGQTHREYVNSKQCSYRPQTWNRMHAPRAQILTFHFAKLIERAEVRVLSLMELAKVFLAGKLETCRPHEIGFGTLRPERNSRYRKGKGKCLQDRKTFFRKCN